MRVCVCVVPVSGDAGKYDIRQHRDLIIGCSVAGIAAVVALTVCLYRCRKRSRHSSVDDPELGDGGISSERGRLAAVQAPPPVPDLCPYNPQTNELASVGQSPTEQYAADCRAIRGAGTGGPWSFDVGGPGGNRCAKDEISDSPGETLFENSQDVRCHLPTGQHAEIREISQAGMLLASEPGNWSPPSKSHDAKTLSTNSDEDEDDDEEEDADDDNAEMMNISEMNNNISNTSISNSVTNNNNNEEEEEERINASEEGTLSTSTDITKSR